MQTMYYKTSSFIQHTGNVVDLEEYRRKAALARESSSLQQDSLARQPQAALWPEEPAFQPVVLSSTPEERRRARRQRRAWSLPCGLCCNGRHNILGFLLKYTQFI